MHDDKSSHCRDLQDRRKEMAKLVSKLGEDGKVAIRYDFDMHCP